MQTSPTFTRALVAGGLGFLGSHLCTRLVERGTDVVCLANGLTGRPGNVAYLHDSGRFRVVHGDVADVGSFSEPVDLVLNFASPASPVDYASFPLETMRAGGFGTWNTLSLANACGARYVMASTSEVYGEPLEHPQRESYWGNVNPVGPRSVYDEAKRFAEALTAAWARHRGTRAAIVRLFNTYGPGMRVDDGRVVPTLIHQALSGQPLTITGDGSQTRTLCYVDDVVTGILAVAASDATGPFNIGGVDELTMLQLVEHVQELTGTTSPLQFLRRPVDDPTRRRPDLQLIADELGWLPTTSLREGLERTVAWFRDEAPDRPAARTAAPASLSR